ncbi:TetR family transcriptional regulator [Actinomycetospora sp. NBRC 106375]|uniref:acyl-CoA-like ligand-binding transcription factor n=1 Tax=Actinomycetospora sp. NBRC 106375 TaxID=3032207 RepID=UPI0024A5DBCE|nr:TetR family transcriptional regulator [Actinomycetospora sp. NBRC 106375]GLZ45199.1 TetR family transcriptional regulator [Actinomycetospora sp. NBRC 106375]
MTTGLRERKKLQTRHALGAAALELAVAHGLAEVTVEQIAEAADVSPRTFFNYFSSKEEAIVAADVERARLMGERLAARPADEPVLASVRAVVREMVAGAGDRQREWIRQVRLVRANPTLVPHQLAAYATIELHLAQVIAERTGLDAHDLYPAVTAAAVMSATRAATTRWLAADGRADLTACLDEALDLLAHGLENPPVPGHASPRAP